MARFKVGDVVRVRDTAERVFTCPEGGYYTLQVRAGELVTIAEVCGEKTYRIIEHPGGYWGEEFFYPRIVKPAPEPKPEFKVGDYVKVEYDGRITHIDGDHYCVVDGGEFWKEINPRYITKQEPAKPKQKMCRLGKVFEMPKNCYDCPIGCADSHANWIYGYEGERRPDICPLVVVDEKEAEA